ncbi:YihY/virulence factor BrkB family protein [Solwaraspora sp. WMMD1047]|uniref:YihY/virulence factor BrkB family protein n=1 Tax=Solwaraspora sp. WMMD1047 TaxID=3016102 RepID=UPI00241685D5|nr:YihY/virulence factor BrkB family protein [Solwaraspora sp. WMMD1047]MDG4833386.1 YihY/virulence factor BrkB family protein [Solwaraspora sp. WMMD1047]
MNVFERAIGGIEGRLNAARRRSRGFDHFARALGRYMDVLGGRLAAGIAYYGFFAVFALALVAYSVFGAVLDASAGVRDAVADFLELNLPFLVPEQIQQSSGRVGVIGLILLAITGIGWVESIRSSQRLIYKLNQQPGYIVLRQLVDLAVLVGVFLLLGLSVGAVDALSSLLVWAFGERSLTSEVSGWVLAVVVNMVLASALLVAVPRLRMTPRRLLSPVIIVAVGITLLNTLGRFYVGRMERNPAYTVVAGAVGLLIYLYLFNQLLLFGAAFAATSRHGRVIDLATGADVPDQSGATGGFSAVATGRERETY